jgi:sterol desaturase/sphingolipid hydroxylase (fatty acid hydroxylase superfamily)
MEEWGWNLVSLTTGLCLFGLSLAFPFRRLDTKPEIAWDLTGIAAAIAFAAGADLLLSSVLDRTLEFPSVQHWIDMLLRWPFWVLLLGNLVIEDFVAYWAHRMLHTSVFWHTHAWHHSSKHLYWAAGLRASPIHVLALFAPSYVIYFLFPSPETGAAGAFAVVASILTQHLTHSNIRVPYARQVELIFVTPRFHFAHHSADMARGNSNFGFTFTWWDRLFGTYTDPDTMPANDPLGLNYEASRWRMLLGISARTNKASARAPSIPGAERG